MSEQTVEHSAEVPQPFVEPSIADMLQERGSRYGKFDSHALITQNLKIVLQQQQKFYAMPADMREALDMILHKVGRIVNGDPNYIDSWDDIQGYAKLVSDRLREVTKAPF